MASQQDEELREKLKASLWFSVGKIVDEETLRLNTNATPQFIGALTEMVWTQIENVATDLHSFCTHANRSTISTDDVLLVTRRNDALYGIVREFIEAGKAKETEKQRKVGMGTGRGQANGKGNGVVKGKGKAKGKGVDRR